MITGFTLTEKGKKYLAKAIDTKVLNITKAEYGKGQPAQADNLVEALTSKVGNLPITNKQSKNDKLIITTQFTNQTSGGTLPAFKMTEVGLFAKVESKQGVVDPDCPEALIAYGHAAESEADYINGTLSEFIIAFNLNISNATNTTVTIDESLIYFKKSEAGKASGVVTLSEQGKIDRKYLPDGVFLEVTEKGKPNGVATLDSGGKVPKAQLPEIQIAENQVVQGSMKPVTGGAVYTELGKRDEGIGQLQRDLAGKAESNHTHANATSSQEGFMSPANYSKLQGIQAGAQKNVKSDWNSSSGDSQILNKPDLSVYAKAKDLENKVDKVEGKGLSTNDYTNEEKEKLQIMIDESQNLGAELMSILTSFTTEIDKKIDKKVDKESGKGLSTNDYTNEYKHTIMVMLRWLRNHNYNNIEIAMNNIMSLIDSKQAVINFYTQAKLDKNAWESSGNYRTNYQPVKDMISWKSYEIAIDGTRATPEQYEAFSNAKIVGTHNPNGLKCLGDKPTIDIPIILKEV